MTAQKAAHGRETDRCDGAICAFQHLYANILRAEDEAKKAAEQQAAAQDAPAPVEPPVVSPAE